MEDTDATRIGLIKYIGQRIVLQTPDCILLDQFARDLLNLRLSTRSRFHQMEIY